VERVFLACGANIAGPWGRPAQTLGRIPAELAANGVTVVSGSPSYSTAPVGHQRQPRYLNFVLEIRTGLPAGSLLRVLKRLERRAGRRPARHAGPRPLDIDIIDYPQVRTRWPGPRRRRAGQLILPHPECHRRAFVLVPLLDIAPYWRHPQLQATGRLLLARLGPGWQRHIARCRPPAHAARARDLNSMQD